MNYPEILIPNSIEKFVIDGKELLIPKCKIEFKKWNGEPMKNTFGGKPILDFDNKPMFAELIIMNIFQNSGWNSRWIETYGKPKMKPICLTEWIDTEFKNQVDNPINNLEIETLLNSIAENNDKNYGGCWDIVSWKNDKILFSESKRTKKDFIQSTQSKWLKCSLNLGLKPDNFLMVEWKLK